MGKRILQDASDWNEWFRQNLESNQPPIPLIAMLIRNQFSLKSIKNAMGPHFPLQPSTAFKDLAQFPDWLGWLSHNLELLCSPEELSNILYINQFSPESIRLAMGDRYPGPPETSIDYEALAYVPLSDKSQALKIHKIPSDKLQLYIIEDFFTPDECAYLIQAGVADLKPSTILRLHEEGKLANTSGTLAQEHRSSFTGYLNDTKDPMVAKLNERIYNAMGIRGTYAEMTQLQKYAINQQYKAHKDYFMPGTDELNIYAKDRGNRTWTFMVYLNEGMQGGGTAFPAINQVFLPKIGTAVVWNNLYPDGSINPDTIHAGQPILTGEKYIITKWFRELGTGNMFL